MSIQKSGVFLIVLCAFGLNLFFSCSPNLTLYRKITIAGSQIPPDIAKQDFVLIGALRGKNSYNKSLKKAFARYTGPYKLEFSENIESEYSDINKYRFVLDHDREQTSYSGTGPAYNICYRFYIYDRKERIKYVSDVVTCNYYERMIAYVMAIDSVRKK
jgi:hypothetical protein